MKRFSLVFVLLLLPQTLVALSPYQQCVQNALQSGAGTAGMIQCINQHMSTPIPPTADLELPDVDVEALKAREADYVPPAAFSSSSSAPSNHVELVEEEADIQGTEQAVTQQQAASSAQARYSNVLHITGIKRHCPHHARGTTPEEKKQNPGAVCLCVTGYIVNAARTSCVKDPEYDPRFPEHYKQVQKRRVEKAQAAARAAQQTTEQGSTVQTAAKQSKYDTVALPDDVSDEDWYARDLRFFLAHNLFDSAEPFAPADNATRAEFIRLVVKASGVQYTLREDADPTTGLFDDVRGYYQEFFEIAAIKGWVTGESNCYKQFTPCYGRPDRPINRAEAAALINRVFQLSASGTTVPTFSDTIANEWYEPHIELASGNCILLGDSDADTVRPGDSLNRAEMISMVARVGKRKKYPDCGVQQVVEKPQPIRTPVEEEEEDPDPLLKQNFS